MRSLDSAEGSAAVVLTTLPAMTPRRLRALLQGRSPSNVLSSLTSWSASEGPPSTPLDAVFSAQGRHREGRRLGEMWQSALDDTRARVLAGCRTVERAMGVVLLGDEDYPSILDKDPHAPAVLFVTGDLAALRRPRVGIVGTRHATAHGRACARHFGAVLSDHGIAVVSGLARGIDVSAHRGVLANLSVSTNDCAGPPIGVVASGLDVVYPPEHEDVWNAVVRHGVLVSESPPGTEPQAFRFPLRNRIIAGLCDVLIVVESRITGGSMITVREALSRGVTVMAVPGSTSTRASEGTNALIRDGASIAIEPDDVLAVLGIEEHKRCPEFDPRPRPTEGDAEILQTIGDSPVILEQIVQRTGGELGAVALALGRLEAQGWLMCTAGWFERLGPAC